MDEERAHHCWRMASPVAGAGGGELAIDVDALAVGGTLRKQRKCKSNDAEKRLNRFVRRVAFGEWAGDAVGTLAFLWATVVLLGGFCSSLPPTDFWCAMAMIFMESFRQVALSRGSPDYEIVAAAPTIDCVGFPDRPRSIAPVVMAVLLLSLRPPRVASLITDSCRGRKFLSLTKAVSAMFLVGHLVLQPAGLSSLARCLRYLGMPLVALLLALCSLQETPSRGTPPAACHWIDKTLHICFHGEMVFSILRAKSTIPSVAVLLVLLIGNLQIPTAIARVVLSSWRLWWLAHNMYPKMNIPADDMNKHILVPLVIKVFYWMALCQGTLYILACILELFSFFRRRSLVRLYGFKGQGGARAVDLYYKRTYATCMETGIFAPGSAISLTSFAMESLNSDSRETQLAAVCVLGSLLQRRDSSGDREELISRITNSDRVVSALVSMLGRTAVQDNEIRVFAARVTAELASSLRIGAVPRMLTLVSSLLGEAENQPTLITHASENDTLPQAACDTEARNELPTTHEHVSAHGEDGTTKDSYWICAWVLQRWWRLKERWSVPDEPPLTHQDSFPILGMSILERLACDLENSAEIGRATDLISRIIGFMCYTSDAASSDNEQQKALMQSSLNLVRRLAFTSGKIGATLRKELWENPFLLSNLAGIMEDSHNCPELWEPMLDIIAKLALDEDARQEIGRSQVIIDKLMHAFLGRDGPDQSLRTAAGEALVNLSIGSAANCLAMFEDQGCKLIKDLKDMLFNDEYRYVAASLLLNLCANSPDVLCHPRSREHLAAALPVVMEKITAAKSKQLEALIGVASQICSLIPECIVQTLESHPGVEAFVQKLVSVLHSNKKPSPEHPRMRRVIVQITVSLLESFPRYATIFREQGMMEALSKVEKTPSKVEKYRVFYGNTGVILESGVPLTVLVARAKGLISSAAPTPSAQPVDDP
ncbi:hypothetical protein EJB05_43985, partial [Eragrostis curvula]